jgi:hypothetical protein
MARKPTIAPRRPAQATRRRQKRSGAQVAKRPSAQAGLVASGRRAGAQALERPDAREVQAPKLPSGQAPVTAKGNREDEHSDAQVPKRSGARAPIVRADGRELRKLHVYLAVKTAKQLAIFCAEVERDMSDVVEEAVSRFLAAAAK